MTMGYDDDQKALVELLKKIQNGEEESCDLDIEIMEGKFLKNHDVGKGQDAYALFDYKGSIYKTEVKENAGLSARWNERFLLDGVTSDFFIKF